MVHPQGTEQRVSVCANTARAVLSFLYSQNYSDHVGNHCSLLLLIVSFQQFAIATSHLCLSVLP